MTLLIQLITLVFRKKIQRTNQVIYFIEERNLVFPYCFIQCQSTPNKPQANILNSRIQSYLQQFLIVRVLWSFCPVMMLVPENIELEGGNFTPFRWIHFHVGGSFVLYLVPFLLFQPLWSLYNMIWIFDTYIAFENKDSSSIMARHEIQNPTKLWVRQSQDPSGKAIKHQMFRLVLGLDSTCVWPIGMFKPSGTRCSQMLNINLIKSL